MKPCKILFLLFIFVNICFTQDAVHIEKRDGWTKAPTTIDLLNQRIESSAYEYRMYAPIPRAAFFDMAYPANAAEYDSLEGHALLLLSCIVQDSIEIPPKRLYVTKDDTEYELDHIMTMLYEIPDTNYTIISVFGKYRSDSIYLFPIRLRSAGSELYMDYKLNRNAFRITVFDDSDPLNFTYLKEYNYTTKPDTTYVLKFMFREFPSLLSH
jgi:hypothetical protein